MVLTSFCGSGTREPEIGRRRQNTISLQHHSSENWKLEIGKRGIFFFGNCGVWLQELEVAQDLSALETLYEGRSSVLMMMMMMMMGYWW
jgi:hypothetical protein